MSAIGHWISDLLSEFMADLGRKSRSTDAWSPSGGGLEEAQRKTKVRTGFSTAHVDKGRGEP
jgi:hypothetical protein